MLYNILPGCILDMLVFPYYLSHLCQTCCQPKLISVCSQRKIRAKLLTAWINTSASWIVRGNMAVIWAITNCSSYKWSYNWNVLNLSWKSILKKCMLVVLSTYLILEVLYTGFILDQETFKKVKILIKKKIRLSRSWIGQEFAQIWSLGQKR